MPQRAISRRRTPLEEFFISFHEKKSPFAHLVITLIFSRLVSVIPPPQYGDTPNVRPQQWQDLGKFVNYDDSDDDNFGMEEKYDEDRGKE